MIFGKISSKIIVILFVLSSTCFGRDIFVSGRLGDNRNSGYFEEDQGIMDGPVRTITRALEIVQAGDRIILDPESGPYRESISLVGKKWSGTSDLPLIIEGNGAVLEGSEPVPHGIWQVCDGDTYRFQMTMQPADWSFFHLLDGGRPLRKILVDPNSTQLPELEDDSWCIFKGFLYFKPQPDKSPMFSNDYDLAISQRMTGVSLVQILNVRIHDLTVQGFQRDGISAANGAQHIILDNVICRVNGRSGLTIGGASLVLAGYCRFEENQTTQVLVQPYAKGHFFECELPENGITKTSEENCVVTVENE